ncbi:MAG TPA: pyridoxamine 5'-phosphate oxidase [Bacteroidota bacterium]|nr:pyridoxamine 5'-phosphate oxidase [Bacteroidota bacterium]
MPRVTRLISLKKSPRDPYVLFGKWFESAVKAKLKLPNAMTLATASKGGKPGARVVLMKDVNRSGVCFFTNYLSRKGVDLLANPRATLLFYWPELDLQIRIEGRATRVPAKESDAYFRTRPRESQIGAHASHQSRPIPDQSVLFEAFWKLSRKFGGKEVPRPKNWGGYRLKPLSFEFWKGQDFRLHDRLLYTRTGSGRWKKILLSP